MLALIIAEKPSVAADIAKALGGFTKRQGYFASEQYLLSWALGHLVELAPPEEYRPEWKSWRAASLPIIPAEFRLVPIAKTKAQLDLLRRLAFDTRVGEYINACDAGREGELIFRYVVSSIGCHKPARRLWISSLTPSAIRRGFQELSTQMPDDARYEKLYHAARCRSEADWLVGINATRAVTVRQRQVGKGALYSLGRVQTPTLAIVVHRELEIAEFEPKAFWEMEGFFHYAGPPDIEMSGRWFKGEEQRLWSREEMEALLQKLRQPELPAEAIVIAAETKERREAPPLLYDLTSLQREANRRFGFTASRTLKAAQNLYERHKLISYPRTDSRFLTPDLAPGLPRRIRAGQNGSPYMEFATELLQLPKLPLSGRVINQAKVRDHHALIPTETPVPWGKISGDERRVLELIHQAFLAVFFPDAIWQDHEIITECRSELFRSKEARLISPGWRRLHNAKPALATLPELKPDQVLSLINLEVHEGSTKPPPRFNEGTLLSAMERAGSLLDDDALAEAMRENGLGTAATRAATIERLKQVGYLDERGRELCPTPKGIALIKDLPVEALRSPQLTGQWEAKLTAIQKGEYDPVRFISELAVFTSEIVALCLAADALRQEEAALTRAKAGERIVEAKSAAAEVDALTTSWGPCPLCGAEIRENRKAYYCSRWREDTPCDFTLWKKIAGKTLTANQVNALLSKGKTGLLKGFRTQKGGRFDAVLSLEEGKVVFKIQPRAPKKTKSSVPDSSAQWS